MLDNGPCFKKIFFVFILYALSSIENVYSHIRIEILERYNREHLILSGIRWKNYDWQACFKTPAGFYVTTHKGQFMGREFGRIVNIEKSFVIVSEYFLENEEQELWSERIIKIDLPPNSICDWKNSVPNYTVDLEE
jgi:Tfp pilus assembly protein PilP